MVDSIVLASLVQPSKRIESYSNAAVPSRRLAEGTEFAHGGAGAVGAAPAKTPRLESGVTKEASSSMRTRTATLLLAAAATFTTSAAADFTEARCDVYPRGSDHTDVVIPCTFGQRQGNVTITRSDGVTHDLVQVEEQPGHYRDQHANEVIRDVSGLGEAGLIFRFPDESVYVYWDTSALEPADPDNPTWPFTTAEYDATTLLRCGTVGADELGTCPAGVLRMEGGQGSVVILGLAGEQFTINFMQDYVNATSGEVEAHLEGDTWMVTINGEERYEVPLALIEGG